MRRSPLLAFLPVLAALLVWEFLYRGAYLAPANSASPAKTAAVLVKFLAAPDIYVQVGYTLGRLIVGVSLGVILALPVALFISMDALFRRLLHPSFTICANVPIVVWIPFAVMLVGTDEAFKISLVFIASFLATVTMVYDAAAKTHSPFLEAGRALHFRGYTLVRHVVMPAVLPAVIGAIRASIAFGWVVIFFVEYASARSGSEGLGWLIADARSLGRIEEEFAGLILLGALAFLLDRLIGHVQRRALDWMHIAEPL